MPARESVALVAIPLLLAVIIWLPPWGLLVGVGAAALLAGDELLTMARHRGAPCGRGVPLILLAVALAAAWTGGSRWLLVALAAAILVVPTLQLLAPNRPDGALAGAAIALFTVAYIGLGAACLGWLRQWPPDPWGERFILLFLATIWAGDSGAYYVGKGFGRHKMSPRISPNKTWEGLTGGIVTSFAAAALARTAFGLDLAWSHTFAVAAILAVAAPVGDLIESALKRDTRVKDSSALLPGHGGFLDRTDSLFYSAPLVLAYLLLVGVIR
ncbi:MAG: phosphatidate cytidylyltransferase [Acidobacteria bacterium]|nr:phosphatidate cytidylyltransferase [Acidobacteriota bacterium]